MCVDKELVADLLFIDKISEVLLQEGIAFLLWESIEFILEGVLFVNLLFQFVVASFLNRDYLGTYDFQGFIHRELVGIPFEVLQVLINCVYLLLSTPQLFLNHYLWLGSYFLSSVEVNLFISLTRWIDLVIILEKGIDQLHELIQGSYLKLLFIDLNFY